MMGPGPRHGVMSLGRTGLGHVRVGIWQDLTGHAGPQQANGDQYRSNKPYDANGPRRHPTPREDREDEFREAGMS